ncbi:unnamed protein product [Parajaminaea phylloscopi]
MSDSPHFRATHRIRHSRPLTHLAGESSLSESHPPSMGALLSIPLLSGSLLSGLATSCLGGLAFFCTSTAASAFFKSCNCQSSIATRVGFALIFCLDAALAWLSLNRFIMDKLESWTWNWLKMDCETDKGRCYGVLAVHRITFALALFHFLLGLSLIGVKDTRTHRAAIQNGWWGPKLLAWALLVVLAFFIPNGFFAFWANWISLIFATIFILIGLVLLVDFAHSWSETCLDRWEETDSNLWKFTLIGSTAGMYLVVVVATSLLYAYFAASGCSLNITVITLNLFFVIALTALCISPMVQEANPRSGLAQSSMVAAYCTYLIASAVMNRDDEHCNPITRGRGTNAKTTTVVLGAVFTFLAIAYSTSRAATQSGKLVGKGAGRKTGPIALGDGNSTHGSIGPSSYGPLATTSASGGAVTTQQPSKKDSLRIQALMAAVEAGAIPASALDEESDDDDDDDDGDERYRGGSGAGAADDERNGTRYNYALFHAVFAAAICYTAMLLTDWRWVRLEDADQHHGRGGEDLDGAPVVFIGRSVTAMWMRIVSSWICVAFYAWSLLAPVLLPDRFGYT